jgi:WD40 repeat protein
MFVLGLENGSLSLVDEEKDRQCWRKIEAHDKVPEPTPGVYQKNPRGMSVACSPNGSCIASVDRSHDMVKIWNLDGTEKRKYYGIDQRKYYGFMGALESVKFSPRGTLIAIINCEGRMKVYDTKTERLLWELTTPNPMLYSVSFSGDSMFVAAASRCGTVHIRYAATGTQFKNMVMGGIGEFCPTNPNLFATTDGDNLALWNIEAEEEIWNVFHGRDDYFNIENFAHFSPDGTMIATVRQDETPAPEDPDASDTDNESEEQPNYVVVVHADDGRTKFSLKHEQWSTVYEAAFSPDGRQLACVGAKAGTLGLCVLWNTSDGNAICSISIGHRVRSIAWAYNYSEMRRESLAMAKHKRLGAGAKLGVLDDDVLGMVARYHEFPAKLPEHYREFRIHPWDGN